MPSKSLPAYLHQVLEDHVNQSQLTHDDELQGIYDRLTQLNKRVEAIKSTIKKRRDQANQG